MSTSYSDILLTASGDIDLSSNDIQLITTNLESLRQRLALRFEIWAGGEDWKYNTEFGINWRNYIGKAIQKTTLDAEIKRQIFLEPDVIAITSFTSIHDRANRFYQVFFEVSTQEETGIALALFVPDSNEYTVPETIFGSCDFVTGTIIYANKLYKLINFDMKSGGSSTWVRQE